MKLEIVEKVASRKSADAIVLSFVQEKGKPRLVSDVAGLNAQVSPLLKTGDFIGKDGEIAVVYTKGEKEGRVVLLGLGEEKECHLQQVRVAYGALVTHCRLKSWQSVNVLLPQLKHLDDAGVSRAIAEGMHLANYQFVEHKIHDHGKDTKPPIKKATLIDVSPAGKKSCRHTEQLITSVNFARDLVNGNADDVNPQTLGEHAKELAKKYTKLTATVWDKKRIEKEGLHLLLAVNRGSFRDPAFIVMEYRGDPSSKECTAIVGKGITYDTGGLNLKPTGFIETMKSDMAGSAAIMGTMRAAAAMDLKLNLFGVIPATENAIGPQSYKPGDVYNSYAGKTVEITNTDAEGRLVLADALAYTVKNIKPKRVINLATLTGAMVIALGEVATGLFTNNDQLAEELTAAGLETHERVWRFPLYEEYKEVLKSPIADMQNSGGRKAGSICAAIFLQEFVGKTPWAHLDIAGTAYLDKPGGFHPTHATGVGVRLLIQYLENLIK